MPPVPLTRAQMCVLNFFPLYCIDESAGEEGGEKKNGEWVQCNLQPSRQITFHLHITSKFLFACVSKSYVVGKGWFLLRFCEHEYNIIIIESLRHTWELNLEYLPMIDRPDHLLSLSNQSVIEIENRPSTEAFTHVKDIYRNLIIFVQWISCRIHWCWSLL